MLPLAIFISDQSPILSVISTLIPSWITNKSTLLASGELLTLTDGEKTMASLLFVLCLFCIKEKFNASNVINKNTKLKKSRAFEATFYKKTNKLQLIIEIYIAILLKLKPNHWQSFDY